MEAAQTLQYISVICFCMAAALFASAIFQYFKNDIPRVIGSLTGAAARKSIRKMTGSNYANGSSKNKKYISGYTNVAGHFQRPDKQAPETGLKVHAVEAVPARTAEKGQGTATEILDMANKMQSTATEILGTATEVLTPVTNRQDYAPQDSAPTEVLNAQGEETEVSKKQDLGEVKMISELIFMGTDEVIL